MRRLRTGQVCHARVVVCACLVLMPAMGSAQSEDVSARARRLATSEQRGAAITLLEDHLAGQPTDDDARTTLGTILSWEGRYDEARAALRAVLARRADDGDVLAALINVELWSKHPAEAKALADRGLVEAPNDSRFLLGRRQAIAALELARPWEITMTANYDRFSDDRVSWLESLVAVKRVTSAGPIIFRASHAERFGLADDQLELEMYPQFRRGTYAYLSAGTGLDEQLYPKYRFAGDIYQGLGIGFEVFAGVRRLGFQARTSIYQIGLNKYVGNWLLTGKTFSVPDRTGAASKSFHGSLRRYFGSDGTNYVGVRYGRGLARDEVRNLNDFEVLMSDTVGAELNALVRRRVILQISGATSRQDRINQVSLRQHSFSALAGWRF